MLERLKGTNGKYVGTTAYIEKINKGTFLGELLKSKKDFNYYEIFYWSTLSTVFSEIKKDIADKLDIIKYLPQADKNNLSAFISNL